MLDLLLPFPSDLGGVITSGHLVGVLTIKRKRKMPRLATTPRTTRRRFRLKLNLCLAAASATLTLVTNGGHVIGWSSSSPVDQLLTVLHLGLDLIKDEVKDEVRGQT